MNYGTPPHRRHVRKNLFHLEDESRTGVPADILTLIHIEGLKGIEVHSNLLEFQPQNIYIILQCQLERL